MPPLPPFCLTGASGFIGQRVLARLETLGAKDVTLLVRRTEPIARRAASNAWRVVQTDIVDGIPQEAIQPGAAIIHLASATGSAPARTLQRINVQGTQNMLDAARAAHTRHFVYVSSIAAGYRDKRWAPYAKSKAEAEGRVTVADVPYTLVRPTMVFGPGSPNQAALQRLATLAFPLLPGEGHVRVQPIHVDDLAEALVRLATGPAAGAMPISIGGPTPLTMRDLFAAIRRARGLAPREPVRLPLAPLRRFLTIVAGLTASRFPVSAGQFVVFANDSTAGSAPSGVALPTPRISLESMLTAGADA